MKKYQFLAISINDDRRKNLETQFNELGIDGLTFLENPTTIENQSNYITENYSDRDKKIICATKSYISAMIKACSPESPEFTIILEDDVACHKTQFLNGINEIIDNWDKWISPSKMASIGWIPLNNYSYYLKFGSEFTMKSQLGSKVFNNGTFASGFQASIIRKSDISPIVHHFVHPTFEKMKEHLHSQNFPNLNKDNKLIAGDCFINLIIGQARIFPHLAIEQNTKSTMGHNNQDEYWSKFFDGYEVVRNNYWSF